MRDQKIKVRQQSAAKPKTLKCPATIHGHYKGLATEAEAENRVAALPAHTARAGLRALTARLSVGAAERHEHWSSRKGNVCRF